MDHRGQSADNCQLAWLAGFLDGEGSIMLQLRKVKTGQHIVPEVQIANTHKETIERIAEIFSANGIGHHVQTRIDRRKNCKTQFVVRIAGMKRVSKVLELVAPYLVTKKEQAKLSANFIKHRLSVSPNTPYGNHEFGLRSAIQSANRIGISEAICQAPNVLG